MPLTDQSPLEGALSRIIGEPGSSVVQNAAQQAAPAVRNLIDYATPFAKGIANQVKLGAAQPNTPVAQPNAPIQQAMQTVTPAITGASATPFQYGSTVPFQETYLRGTLKAAGVPQNEAENIVGLQRTAYNQAAGGSTGTAAQTPLASAPAPALSRPVNPGPRAPWQQSAQYWKDLESYTKAGGK